METTFLMRQLALVKLGCGDELEALRLVAKLTPDTISQLQARGITSWQQLLHSNHRQLLDSGMWASYIMHIDQVLEQVGWSFCLPESEIIHQLNLTILPTEIILNSPLPSR